MMMRRPNENTIVLHSTYCILFRNDNTLVITFGDGDFRVALTMVNTKKDKCEQSVLSNSKATDWLIAVRPTSP